MLLQMQITANHVRLLAVRFVNRNTQTARACNVGMMVYLLTNVENAVFATLTHV